MRHAAEALCSRWRLGAPRGGRHDKLAWLRGRRDAVELTDEAVAVLMLIVLANRHSWAITRQPRIDHEVGGGCALVTSQTQISASGKLGSSTISKASRFQLLLKRRLSMFHKRQGPKLEPVSFYEHNRKSGFDQQAT
jgi:hypothetical protein